MLRREVTRITTTTVPGVVAATLSMGLFLVVAWAEPSRAEVLERTGFVFVEAWLWALELCMAPYSYGQLVWLRRRHWRAGFIDHRRACAGNALVP